MQLTVEGVQDGIRRNELQNGVLVEEAGVVCIGLAVSWGKGLRLGGAESHIEGKYDPG
jgi:hypothetical protein